MSGELHNVDKSVQIEINYNKCGIVELYRFEVLTEWGRGEEYNMLSLDHNLNAVASSKDGSNMDSGCLSAGCHIHCGQNSNWISPKNAVYLCIEGMANERHIILLVYDVMFNVNLYCHFFLS